MAIPTINLCVINMKHLTTPIHMIDSENRFCHESSHARLCRLSTSIWFTRESASSRYVPFYTFTNLLCDIVASLEWFVQTAHARIRCSFLHSGRLDKQSTANCRFKRETTTDFPANDSVCSVADLAGYQIKYRCCQTNLAEGYADLTNHSYRPGQPENCARPGDSRKFNHNDPGNTCLLYTSPSPRDQRGSRMPSSA